MDDTTDQELQQQQQQQALSTTMHLSEMSKSKIARGESSDALHPLLVDSISYQYLVSFTACNQCKARKMRCSGGMPFCSRCVAAGRTRLCQYTDPPKRSPLTRQYITSLEEKLAQAEKDLEKLRHEKTNGVAGSPSAASTVSTNQQDVDSVTTPAGSSSEKDNDTGDCHSRRSSVQSSVSATSSSRPTSETGSSPSAAFISSSTSSTAAAAAPSTVSTSYKWKEDVDSTDVAFSSQQLPYEHLSMGNVIKEMIALPGDTARGVSYLSLSSFSASCLVAAQLNDLRKGRKDQQDASMADPEEWIKSFAVSTPEKLDFSQPLPSPAVYQHQHSSPQGMSAKARTPLSPWTTSMIRMGASGKREFPHAEPFSRWSVSEQAFITEALAVFFQNWQPLFPVLHEGTFRAQLAGTVPRPAERVWKALVHTVVALGCFLRSNGPRDPHNDEDVPIFAIAMQFLDFAAFETADVDVVQTLFLIAVYVGHKLVSARGVLFTVE